MQPDTVVTSWEIVTVDGGEKLGMVHFIYGIIKNDLKGRFDEGDYVFTTPLTEFDVNTLTGRTINTIYKLEGPGERYEITAEEALVMRNSGLSYKTLTELKANGFEPKNNH